MTNDYVPIDCDQHSVLELLAMRRTSVVALVREDNGAPGSVEGAVIDVHARDGAEYLVLLGGGGNQRSVRLDRLLSLSAPNGESVWRQKTVASDWVA